MGVGVFRPSGCGCDYDSPNIVSEPKKTIKKILVNKNPNPKNFNIIKLETCGKFVILLVNYPDCINYEGNKILVFEGPFKSSSFLDPHFCNGSKHQSPIARFEPTDRGWDWAVKFCESISRGAHYGS